ncbi:unnamed protein product [Bursaphelenchus okinawaensis]|uniref:Uncharacterized protein n=1 Tax=Bursaphelenchus okinawaensis TaxID=465554 RepID=A0A811KYB9_9BILA|nr:unnamed protein product [Bursaphelenchus okinawaensis]CAG9113003.1 unnamed protein product [Bursaphelenchus okinawaensis]
MLNEIQNGRPHITHIIFDFDGILVDSEDRYSMIHSTCLKSFGKEFNIHQKYAILGLRKQDEVRTLLRLNGLEDTIKPEEYIALYEAQYETLLPDCPPMPGADDLIHHLYSSGVPMAICSSSGETEFRIKTRKRFQHWLNMIPFQVLTATDKEVKRGKPFPDPYLITMSRFKSPPASPRNCLVFEDSINGAESALNAGMNCILIPQKQFNCEETLASINELRPRLADVLDSMEDFDPGLYGLPGRFGELEQCPPLETPGCTNSHAPCHVFD